MREKIKNYLAYKYEIGNNEGMTVVCEYSPCCKNKKTKTGLIIPMIIETKNPENNNFEYRCTRCNKLYFVMSDYERRKIISENKLRFN